MLAAGAKLRGVPAEFGAWRLESSEELAQNVIDLLQCAGQFHRVYLNQETGDTVSVAVMFGPSGPISVHTPEVCYSSRAYAIRDPRQKTEIKSADGSHDAFWQVTFRSNDLDSEALRVYYAWSDGTTWSAPGQPRFAFAASPHLYKIQLAAQVSSTDEREQDDPCQGFLREFVPALRRCLAGPSTQ
jgi:hypothetical protein